MVRPSRLHGGALVLLAIHAAACSFNSTATHWNGRVGLDGKPVFVKTSTNVGMNLFVALPLGGNLNTDELVDATTQAIRDENGDKVRVVETSWNNGWNGLPPLTLLFTPVVTRISIEYQPSAEELEKARQQQAVEAAARKQRGERRDDEPVV